MVTLYGDMGYGAMVLHGAENCTKITPSYDHDAIA
jgi:hypothetical protein